MKTLTAEEALEVMRAVDKILVICGSQPILPFFTDNPIAKSIPQDVYEAMLLNIGNSIGLAFTEVRDELVKQTPEDVVTRVTSKGGSDGKEG